MDTLQTGDLLLFTESSKGLFGLFVNMIKLGSSSSYTHTAMVLKNPTFINPSLTGTYVWESSWEGEPDPQDGKIKLGVQITPIEEIMNAYKKIGHVFLRKMNVPEGSEDYFSDEKLKEIHEVVYNKPYDIVPIDWIEALIQKDFNPQKINRFWCSALSGYIYTKCGILDPSTDWSILRPCDFALSSDNLKYINNCHLSNTETKIQ